MLKLSSKVSGRRARKIQALNVYKHLWDDDSDIQLLWGGRDSGKSHYIGQRLLLECRQKDYFRCILIKKTYESIKDSQYQQIKDIAVSMGIDHEFAFRVSPLEIEHLSTGNKFIARGCDKPEKMKSISNPSHTWVEEANQLTQEDYITISTTLRSNYGRVQEWLSFNPECRERYEDFWLYRDFIGGKRKSFKETRTITLEDGREVEIKITSTHSTYKDNIFVTPERIARHEGLKETNPHKYQVYTLGEWGNEEPGTPFIYAYSQATNYTEEPYHLQDRELQLSFDFNKSPCTLLVSQKDDNGHFHSFDIILADEKTLIGKTPLEAVCELFKRKYLDNGKVLRSRIMVTGDATGRRGSADYIGNMGNYTKIMNYLQLDDRMNFSVLKANMKHTTSRDLCNDFINNCVYLIHESAKRLADEMKLAYADDKGTLNKAKDELGLHILDAFRYQVQYWHPLEKFLSKS